MPQGASRRAGERLPLVPRVQRLRQLAGVRRLGQGARSFYYPAKPQKCADCHMPLVDSNDPAAKDGMVRSHRFPGANTAAAVRQRRRRAAEGGAGLPAGRRRSRSTCSASSAATSRGRRAARARRRERRTGSSRARLPSAKSRCSSAPRQAFVADRRPTSSRPLGKVPVRSCARGESVRRRSGRPHAQGRPLLPGRHGGRVRRLGRARGGRRARAGDLPQRRGRRRRQGARSIRGRTSIAACSSTSTATDQQAQRLDDAIGRLRAADSARRRRHGSLPPADSGAMPADTITCAPRSTIASSPGGTRSGRSPACAIRRDAGRRRSRQVLRRWRVACSPATRRTCRAR